MIHQTFWLHCVCIVESVGCDDVGERRRACGVRMRGRGRRVQVVREEESVGSVDVGEREDGAV